MMQSQKSNAGTVSSKNNSRLAQIKIEDDDLVKKFIIANQKKQQEAKKKPIVRKNENVFANDVKNIR